MIKQIVLTSKKKQWTQIPSSRTFKSNLVKFVVDEWGNDRSTFIDVLVVVRKCSYKKFPFLPLSIAGRGQRQFAVLVVLESLICQFHT